MSGNKNLYYRKPPGPCKDCAERHLGCHGECEKYQKWSKEEKELNGKILSEKKSESVQKSYEIKRHTKRMKSVWGGFFK